MEWAAIEATTTKDKSFIQSLKAEHNGITMIRLLHAHRFVIALLVALGSFAWLWSTYPFPGPGRNPLLDVVHIHSPYSWMALYSVWVLGLFWLPFLYVFHPALANLRRMWPEKPGAVLGPLPAYPDPRRREELSVVIGELHHPDKIEPSATPAWLEIPQEGLTLGLLVLGSPGSGKSAGLVLPAAEQLFAYRAQRSRQARRWISPGGQR